MKNKIKIYIDGDCYVCNSFIKYIELKKIMKVEIIDLRQNTDKVGAFLKQGFDVNKGMVVEFDSKIYFKEEAIQIINTILDNKNFLDKARIFIFNSKILGAILYFIFNDTRRILLFLSFKKIRF